MSELVKRLREPITDLGRSYPGAALDLANDDRERAAQQLEAQTALIAELVEALKPFAFKTSWPLIGINAENPVHCEAIQPSYDKEGGHKLASFGLSVRDFYNAGAALSKAAEKSV